LLFSAYVHMMNLAPATAIYVLFVCCVRCLSGE